MHQFNLRYNLNHLSTKTLWEDIAKFLVNLYVSSKNMHWIKISWIGPLQCVAQIGVQKENEKKGAEIESNFDSKLPSSVNPQFFQLWAGWSIKASFHGSWGILSDRQSIYSTKYPGQYGRLLLPVDSPSQIGLSFFYSSSLAICPKLFR